MDASPPTQPDAAAAPDAPSSSTSASAPSSAPQPNPTPSASTAGPPTSNSAPALTPTPTLAPVQTLEASASSPASARPPVPRMRPPYTHLASPITMSSPATAAASSSSASSPAAAASASSAMPRGGVAIGLPAHPRGPQTPVGYTGFVPPPTLAAQFSSMQNRGPDQPPPSTQKTPTHTLARPPSMASSPSTALQQTPPNVSAPLGPPQQRPHVIHPRPYHAPAISHPQNLLLAQQQQQKVPQHQHLQQQQQQSQPQHSLQQNQQTTALRNQQQVSQQQAARNPVSMAQKLYSPATLQATNKQSVDMALANVDAGGSGNRLLSKRSIHELVAQIDPSENLDPEVEDVLIDIAEDFVESHRKSSTLEAKDVLLHAERSWNITLPGFSGDEIKLYKKPHVNDIHRERLTLIKKSMASESNTKSSAAQAAANQKNQTPKPPATGSP
ncbi:hypothetical protein ABZP36_015864 [Zizania latifolia]